MNPIDRVQVINNVAVCIPSIGSLTTNPNVSDQSDSGHLQHTGMYPIDQIQVIDNEPEFF